MDIPHMQERLQLAALYKQVFDLMDEEDQALAPLNGDALAAAHRAFRAKRDAIREDMKTIENAIGAKLAHNLCNDSHDFCAITGLPILDSDPVGVVLIDALLVIQARQNEAA